MRTKILKATLAIMAVVLIASGFAIASAANAATFSCDAPVCIGTQARDHITGTSASQTISGGAKGDTIIDTARGDNDSLKGGKGNDRLDVQEGRSGPAEKDVVDGGPGKDQCYVDAGDDVYNCEVVVRG